MKRPGRLLKNKSFWVSTCLGWALNCTWALIKNKKNCQTRKLNTKITKFLPKLITRSQKSFFSLFKLVPRFNWTLKWKDWILNRSFTERPQNMGYLSC